MREEALKRLDEFVDSTCARCEGEYDFDDKRAAWAALRAELAAERCENCQYWGASHRCLSANVQQALGRLGREMPFTPATFYCGYFWAKKKEE